MHPLATRMQSTMDLDPNPTTMNILSMPNGLRTAGSPAPPDMLVYTPNFDLAFQQHPREFKGGSSQQSVSIASTPSTPGDWSRSQTPLSGSSLAMSASSYEVHNLKKRVRELEIMAKSSDSRVRELECQLNKCEGEKQSLRYVHFSLNILNYVIHKN